MPKNTTTTNSHNNIEKKQAADCANIIANLEASLVAEQEKSKRALADYQNLLRRTQEDKIKIIKLAGADMLRAFIDPLDNLRLAANALNDAGLNLVVEQFTHTLIEQGITVIIPKPGDKFDVNTMEAVEKTGDGDKITALLAPGYILNDEVIRYAKVSVG